MREEILNLAENIMGTDTIVTRYSDDFMTILLEMVFKCEICGYWDALDSQSHEPEICYNCVEKIK